MAQKDQSEQQKASEVYAPPSSVSPAEQLWRAAVEWLGFVVELLLQILRGTSPSLPRALPYRLLYPTTPFEPLPVVELAGDSDLPDNKLTVVLDLDETLVCAYETSSLPAIVKTQATEAGLNWFELECVSSDKDCDGKPKISYVTVFERPGLHEFLKQLSEFAVLVLFTAGLEGYASPLVDRIDVENLFSLRLYRPSTVSTEYREHVKDLSRVSKDLSRIVIVDNNPFSFLLQPANGIPCIPFSAGQPHDDQLLEVLLPLLKSLSQNKDVRQVLYERFHMPEWFEMHGVPVSGSPV